MTSRSFVRAAAVLGVVIAILSTTLAVGLLQRRAATRLDLPLFTARVTLATGIRIVDGSRPHREILLRHDGVQWTLVTDDAVVPAREDRIEAFLDQAARSRLTGEATRRRDAFSTLGVDDSAIVVAISVVGGATREERVVIGFEADAGSFYARRGDEATAFIAAGPLPFYATQSREFWMYTRVFPESVRASEIVGVNATAQFDAPGGRVSVATDVYRDYPSDEWIDSLDPSSVIVPEAMHEWTRALADLVGEAFTDEWEGLERVGRFSFVTADGRSFTGEVRRGERYVVEPSGAGLPAERFALGRYIIDDRTALRLFPAIRRRAAR